MSILKKEQTVSIKSIQSTIRKMEKALDQMSRKGANTTLTEKRLKAHRIGLAVLEDIWYQVPHEYSLSDLNDAKSILKDLLPSIESIYEKQKTGSPQKTLLERRIKAMELAVETIEQYKKGR